MMKMRKITAALLALALMLAFAMPAFAAASMVADEAGLLSTSKTAALEAKLAAMSERYECDTVIVTIESAGESTLKDYMAGLYSTGDYGQGGDGNCLMLLIDKENKAWRLATWGDVPAFNKAGLDFLSNRLYDELFEGDDDAALSSYADWCERFFAQEATIGKPYGEGFLPPLDSAAAPGVLARDADSLTLLVDEAGLLSASEAAALQEKLEALSAQWKNDIVIVTVDFIGGASPMDFADDWFDYGGYGQGGDADGLNRDGLLLLINMAERDWYISTCGYSIFAFTDAGIEFLGKQLIADGLSGGDYANAFDKFADWCDKFFARAESGKPYDAGNLPKTSADYVSLVFISFGLGALIAWFVTKGMKKKLKTVQKQQAAADYVRPGSLQVAYATEQFLFKNTTRTKVVESNSGGGGGGSSTHSSSSGSSHGGGGGKF